MSESRSRSSTSWPRRTRGGGAANFGSARSSFNSAGLKRANSRAASSAAPWTPRRAGPLSKELSVARPSPRISVISSSNAASRSTTRSNVSCVRSPLTSWARRKSSSSSLNPGSSAAGDVPTWRRTSRVARRTAASAASVELAPASSIRPKTSPSLCSIEASTAPFPSLRSSRTDSCLIWLSSACIAPLSALGARALFNLRANASTSSVSCALLDSVRARTPSSMLAASALCMKSRRSEISCNCLS